MLAFPARILVSGPMFPLILPLYFVLYFSKCVPVTNIFSFFLIFLSFFG